MPHSYLRAPLPAVPCPLAHRRLPCNFSSSPLIALEEWRLLLEALPTLRGRPALPYTARKSLLALRPPLHTPRWAQEPWSVLPIGLRVAGAGECWERRRKREEGRSLKGAPEEKLSNIKSDTELKQAGMEAVPLVSSQDENRIGPSDLALTGVRDLDREQHTPQVQAHKDFLFGVTFGPT